ncbi:hypothetical protein KIN20_019359, partial [Parelaphostrongylus tenuis]
MANVVPDPDDVMEADYQNHVADETLDDFDVDVGNANLDDDLQIDKCFQNREGTPIPEDTAPANHYGETNATQVSALKLPPFAVVNNPSAVDIETICQSYKGHSLLIRLQFIADHCPPLKRDAIIGMINEIHRNSVNVPRYTELFAALESIEKQPDDQ